MIISQLGTKNTKKPIGCGLSLPHFEILKMGEVALAPEGARISSALLKVDFYLNRVPSLHNLDH